MIVVCPHCSTRLQLDDAKVPARPFTLRCPKCQNIINGQPPAGSTDNSALGVDAPALEHQQFKQPTPARAFRIEPSSAGADGASNDKAHAVNADELTRLLAALLQRAAPSGEKQPLGARRLDWERRRVLICVTPARREAVARTLAAGDYQVFVAEDTTQAVERMREEHMDVVILEPDFDPIEQGVAFVSREINTMRPAERRRIFFVQLSTSVRTMDSHTAFLHNFNLVVNPSDIETLPRILERAIRDFNELYRDFNSALNVAAI
ncbi:MAG TPA: zinc-ribbon domain-containing protein [Pyrinomonadaceae bacterium]|nr:zinc-ribbon domain-containing protein [Pyrinomonadaceae bacterium]